MNVSGKFKRSNRMALTQSLKKLSWKRTLDSNVATPDLSKINFSKTAKRIFVQKSQKIILNKLVHKFRHRLFLIKNRPYRLPVLPYPNITVCTPRMFDITKVKALNISSTLLTYIYYTLDIDATGYFPQMNWNELNTFDHEYLNNDISKVSNIFDHLVIKYDT